MKNYFIESKHTVTNKALTIGSLRRKHKLSGDFILSSVGGLALDRMPLSVQRASEESLPLLHFIAEHKRVKELDIRLRQRLFLSNLVTLIGGNAAERTGRHVYVKGLRLSVARTMTNFHSSLFYVGLFAGTDAHPAYVTLPMLGIQPKTFAYQAMQTYCDDIQGVVSV